MKPLLRFGHRKEEDKGRDDCLYDAWLVTDEVRAIAFLCLVVDANATICLSDGLYKRLHLRSELLL